MRCRECGLPAQIGHLDEITNRPAGESQGLLRPDCPDTYASREPIPGRHLRRPGRDAGRHELLSVRLIESVPGLLEPAHDGELVLHLVASHHGLCRPFAPVVFDREPVTVEEKILGHRMSGSSATGLERLDSGVSERFWRLVRRYGWWGLAWLEALMRLADHRCSEAEQLAHEEAEDGVREAGG